MHRCLYAPASPRTSGDWPSSPALLTALHDRYDVMTAYIATADAAVEPVEPDPALRGEVVRVDDLGEDQFALIVIEAWLYQGPTARIPVSWLQGQVSGGAQLLLLNFKTPDDYEHLADQLVPARLMAPETGGRLLYGHDDLAAINGNPRFIWCEASTMYGVAEQWKAIYDDASEVGALGPIAVWPIGDILATADSGRVRKLTDSDTFQDDDHILIWSTVRNYGVGHIMLTSADVASRYVLSHCPGNLNWLLAVVDHLQAHTEHLGGPPASAQPPATDWRASPDALSLAATFGAQRAGLITERLEEAERCFTGRAYLASVVMLGSALEAALGAAIAANRAFACRSPKVPALSSGKPKDSTRWTLAEMVTVSESVGWLHSAHARFSNVLRDYRNYVHPDRSLREAAVDRRTALLCCTVTTDAIEELVLRLPAPS